LLNRLFKWLLKWLFKRLFLWVLERLLGGLSLSSTLF